MTLQGNLSEDEPDGSNEVMASDLEEKPSNTNATMAATPEESEQKKAGAEASPNLADEIDQKIDAALGFEASKDEKETEDTLEIPAFLRNGKEDLPLA